MCYRAGKFVDTFIHIDCSCSAGQKRCIGSIHLKYEREALNDIDLVTGRSWGGRRHSCQNRAVHETNCTIRIVSALNGFISKA